MYTKLFLILISNCIFSIGLHKAYVRHFPWPFKPKPFKSCFDEIGCVDTGEEWFNKKWRPVNPEPLDRHTIRTEFLLVKSINHTSHELNCDVLVPRNGSINLGAYETSNPTIFLIHDYTSNGETGWIKHLSSPLLENNSYNIISVDWESGAEPPFPQAAVNARVVALEIIYFIKIFKERASLSESNIYLIGHGLGAHVAGYVGKALPGIKKITALDPTGPFFEKMPSKVKLTQRDAQYVEVLHTDAFCDRSEGTLEAMGHADFYINKASLQPGCIESQEYPKFTEISRDFLKEGKIMPGCSHKRAFKYFIESITNQDCKFIGIKCQSLKNLVGANKNGTNKTQNEHLSFGLDVTHATTGKNKYYISTSSSPPFCLHSYKIIITLDEKSPKTEGFFEIIAIDVNNMFSNMTLISNRKDLKILEPGHNYTFIFYASSPKVINVKEARVKWTYKNKPLPFSFIDHKINIKKINIAYVDLDNEQVGNSLCPAMNSTEIISGSYLQFRLCGETQSYTGDETRSKKDIQTDATTFITVNVSKRAVLLEPWMVPLEYPSTTPMFPYLKPLFTIPRLRLKDFLTPSDPLLEVKPDLN